MGGFGCVSPDTKVWTESGLIRISEITKPTRVLSWNDKNQKYQLSLTGGAFPKGRANLYRVVTKQGQFDASGEHQALLSGGSYSPVKNLYAGQKLSSLGLKSHSETPAFYYAKRLLSHYSIVNKNSMRDYANKARTYGQQFLAKKETSSGFTHLDKCNKQLFGEPFLDSDEILSVSIKNKSEPYYDMQVLDTNNYICESGLIHHNSGKTFIGCTDLLLFAGKHPKAPQAYFGCTYPSIRDIFYPTLEEAGHLLGFKVDIKTGNKECHLYRNGFYYGTIICRSMDNPGSIVGFKVARALVDEIDTLNKDKAALAWRKIIARLRFTIPNVVNGVGVTTTPEGFLFVYDKFKKEPTESYSMVQASTYENAKYLPDDYISSLLESYPEQIAQAYINGDFVNLTSGRVYTGYDRILNGSDRVWIPGEPVYIGMDFNVGQMAAVVHVKENGNPIAVDEIMGALDTPAMIESIKQRYPNTTIRIYPDASGGSRKSVDASKTDLLLLEREGWTICADKKNPFVKDRVMAVNHAFCNTSGDRVYKVNTDRCPTYADCLEQQIYNDSGEPDKKGGKDHANDAGGYFIAQDYPIDRPVANY
ncbi:MAG TPA: terminase family protein, partial [Psychromonas sp.]